jgi:hypothetical protein
MGFILITAAMIETNNGKKQEIKIRNIAGLSPIPNQIIANGIQARGEIGRKNCIRLLKILFPIVHRPSNNPIGKASMKAI